MEPFSLEWAAQCMGGQIYGNATGTVTSVCVDSRQVKPGALFFALRGENADGHRYVAQAFRAGAVGCVVERLTTEDKTENQRDNEEEQGAQIVVPAALRALGELARHYHRQFAIPIIGVTGSVGKTSTKEMIATILRTTYKTLASEKNYNTETGVPLTLFNLDKTHEIAVIEMGMRGLGQIDYLAEIAEPTIGVITNIGFSHIALLGSQENIARAKAELFARLPTEGVAILYDKTYRWPAVEAQIPEGCRVITFSTTSISKQNDVRADSRRTQIHADGTVSFRVRVGNTTQSLPVKLQAMGTHHVPNALAALAVAYALDIPTERAIAALEGWTGAEGRMTVRHTSDNITVLDDCYNASPESMQGALETLAKMPAPHIAVLGDMRELGEYAEQAHRNFGEHIRFYGFHLVTVGDMAALIADEIQQMQSGTSRYKFTDSIASVGRLAERHSAGYFQYPETSNERLLLRFADAQEAAAHIRELVRHGDTVLVKGSRAMGMEVIVDALLTEKDTTDDTNETDRTGKRNKDTHD
jgi:UDP-N-acetylmuramoyl-tripeptide--D-alanyl-D-alanine ligase